MWKVTLGCINEHVGQAIATPQIDARAPTSSEGRQPTRARRVTSFGPALAMLAALGLASAIAIATYIPGGVSPASAPPDQFSAERALPHLQAIALEPHPIGSAEDAAVGDYLLEQLSNIGVQPITQRGTYFNPTTGDAAIVCNVLVRLNGTTSSNAVLVVAHYDSVESSSGTGDDGMAVASMLETIRALQSGPRLRLLAVVAAAWPDAVRGYPTFVGARVGLPGSE